MMRRIMQILSWIIIVICLALLVYCICLPQETANGTSVGEMITHFGWGAAFLPGVYYVLLWGNLTDDDQGTINEYFGMWSVIGRFLPLLIFIVFPWIVRKLFDIEKHSTVFSSDAILFVTACLLFHINLLVFQKKYSKMLKNKQHEKDLLKSIHYSNSYAADSEGTVLVGDEQLDYREPE